MIVFSEKLQQSFAGKESETNWMDLDCLVNEIRNEILIDSQKSHIFINDDICCDLLSQRSKLITSSLSLISELCLTISTLEIFLPSLLKLCERSNSIISNRAGECLLTSLESIPSMNFEVLFEHFKEKISSPNKKVRQIIPPSLSVLLVRNSNNSLIIEEYPLLIAKLLQDSDEKVRNGAKETFKIFIANHSSLEDYVRSQLSPQILNSLSPAPSAPQPKEKKITKTKPFQH